MKNKSNIPASPLRSSEEAQKVGPIIAAAHGGKFTGQWTTVIEGAMNVVELEITVSNNGTSNYNMGFLAGRIWSNEESRVESSILSFALLRVANGMASSIR